MTDLKDKLIIIEHPGMYHSDVLAQVIRETKHKVYVTYWSLRDVNWQMDPAGSQRDKKHITRILEDTKLFTPNLCQSIALELHKLREEQRRIKMETIQNYNQKVKDLKYDL